MKTEKQKAWILVSLQFCSLIYILVTTPFKPAPVSLILLGLASLLLVWAVITMSTSKLRVLPQPATQAKLVTTGPYHLIRHPMYTSLITGALALVLLNPTPARVLVFLILVTVLFLKLTFEERLLMQKFPEYSAYKKRTYRLIPFIL